MFLFPRCLYQGLQFLFVLRVGLHYRGVVHHLSHSSRQQMVQILSQLYALALEEPRSRFSIMALHPLK